MYLSGRAFAEHWQAPGFHSHCSHSTYSHVQNPCPQSNIPDQLNQVLRSDKEFHAHLVIIMYTQT